MASQFYARYIPPDNNESGAKVAVQAASIENGNCSESKKRTRQKKPSGLLPAASGNEPDHTQESNASDSIAAVVDQHPDGQSKKRKRRKEPDEPVQDEGNHEGLEDDTKHKRIKSKFEKSSKLAAELRGKTPDSKDAQQASPVETHGLVPLPQPEETSDTAPNITFSPLPEWMSRPVKVVAESILPFKDLSLAPSTLKSLASHGYDSAFAIQAAVLPMLVPGPTQYQGDLCISAATGSGKTLAYVLPMVEALRDMPVTRLRGLIVVPTRELVSQVRETLQSCAAGAGLKIGTAVGSNTMAEEKAALVEKRQRYDPEASRKAEEERRKTEEDLMNWDDDVEEPDNTEALPGFVTEYASSVDILICTPGRLIDHMRSTKGFVLDHVHWLVIDEADKLLDQSFQQWVEIVIPALQTLPKPDHQTEMLNKLFRSYQKRHVRKIILSATMTRDISKILKLQLQRPRLVVLEGMNMSGGTHGVAMQDAGAQQILEVPQGLKEIAIPMGKNDEKPLLLLQVLERVEKPGQKAADRRALQNIKDRDDNDDDDEETSGSTSPDDSTSSNSITSSDDDTDETSDSSPTSDSDNTSSDSESTPSTTLSETLRSPHSSPLPHPTRPHGALIFTNNNENAMRLARLLALLRPAWASRIGTLTKSTATSAGRRTLAAFRKRKLCFLVASDRASRGLDIQNLAHVVNYDMPTRLTGYLHRVGRTARAGRGGTATTLVAHHEARWFWNEIARSALVRRAGKVSREEGLGAGVTEVDRERYVHALRRLGQEARGETG